MARREQFSVDTLAVYTGLEMPVYEQATRDRLKTLLNRKFLQESDTSASDVTGITDREQRIRSIQRQVWQNSSESGTTVMAFVHGVRKLEDGTALTSANYDAQTVDDINDSRYKDAFPLVTGDHNLAAVQAEMGMYILFFVANPYSQDATKERGIWYYKKMAKR